MKKNKTTKIILWFIIFVVLIVAGYLFLFPEGVFPILQNLGLEYFVFYNVLLLLLMLWLVVSDHLTRIKTQRISELENKIREIQSQQKKRFNSEEIALSTLPIGIMLYDEDFNIVYANGYAKEIFSNALVDRVIKVINRDLYENVSKRIGKFMTQVYDKTYDVVHYPKNGTIYLFEVTERELIKQKYYDYSDVIGVMSLDNFNEATSNLDFQVKANIQGLLLSSLNNWCSSNDIYFINLRPEKSVIMFDRKKLDHLMKEQFNILNTISKIASENDIRVTLSIGIAAYEATPSELGEAAEEALKLAIARGGDQVVVNLKNQPIKFFGGKTNTVEKRSKIAAKVNSRALEDFFSERSSVYIMPHQFTDLDALGAAIGLLEMALTKNKKSKIVLDFDNVDQTTSKLINMLNQEYVKLLDYIIDPDDAIDQINHESLLILVDHHSPVQSNVPTLTEKTKHIVVIDHHRRLDNQISDMLMNYVEPYASSSVELVTELIDFFREDVIIDPFEATIMLAGMMIDTNNFTVRTGARTFESAAKLRLFGAEPSKAKLILRESLDDIKTKSNLVNRAKIFNSHFALTVLEKNDLTDRTQLAKTADELLEIDNIIAAFAIGFISNDTVAVSARSINNFNVQIIMEKLGGGGHLNNAAAQIKDASPDKIAQEIEMLISENFKEEESMKLILIKDVKGRGKKGDVIEVATGYGNYLLTSKHAITANTANIKSLNEEIEKQKQEANKEYQNALELKKEIEDSPIKLYVKIGESGKLFGSINTKQIADELKKTYNIVVDKRKIDLTDNINSLGSYTVDIKLHKDVIAKISIQVLEQE
ncbi:MAG: 50S ribosomal protein L9 [Candidatus Izemoplasmatales bacterium]